MGAGRKMGGLAAAGALAAASAAGCAPHGRAHRSAPMARSDPDFLAPPELTGVQHDRAGGVLIAGRAAPGSRVVLVSPDGERHDADADADAGGAWSVALPRADAPRAFALSAAGAGRTVRAQGAVLVGAAPDAPVVMLRAGAPAWPVRDAGVATGLQWLTADMDAGGGAAVSGFAVPGAGVSLYIDGVASGAGRADALGRFAVLWLGAPVGEGVHRVGVATTSASRTLALRFGGAAPLNGAPLRAAREAEGWRVVWAPPGGGDQTTLVLDAADAAVVR